MEPMEEDKVFLDNCWYAAAWIHEVEQANYKLGRTICEQPIIFFQTESGAYVALDNRCCHRAAPLTLGRIEKNCIRCMYHGMLYDETGKCIEIPGQAQIPETMRVRSYPVEEKGGMLWIWMGDPEQANTNDIIDFAPLSETDKWTGFDEPAYLHYDANWLLIVDNLSDFSHVAFVHTNTLGGSESYAYTSVPEVIERLDTGFRMDRWHYESGPPPYHAKTIPTEEKSILVDRRNLTEMHIPGVFLMETSFRPAGQNEQANQPGSYQYRNCQFMTPETRNSTHFFWNYLHEAERQEPDLAESLRVSLLEGFIEDKIIIEAQQKRLQEDPTFDPKFLVADKPFALVRRIWNKRLEEEAQANPKPPPTYSRNRIL
ncbi:MAG: phenylpropionate dioxygenase-like ring-hydroxylating dioxygenase large terminal subunit [Limisphaerales bacterium]|jgi:phenylpropionate dioxygenase-like ring-hydroxylating dioxygenase large terminal subunit